MLYKDYTTELLDLEGVTVTNVENRADEVHVFLELPREKHCCPACGALTDRVNDYRMQTIKAVQLARTPFLHLRNRRYLQTIQWLINKFSRHMGESMVTVTTAKPLSKKQVDKLIAIYSAKTGHPVHINSVVDPTVIGGMRIQVGDEVTDNTVVAQLQHLQRTVKATA